MKDNETEWKPMKKMYLSVSISFYALYFLENCNADPSVADSGEGLKDGGAVWSTDDFPGATGEKLVLTGGSYHLKS